MYVFLLAVVVSGGLPNPASLVAQEAPVETESSVSVGPKVRDYFDALADKRLLAAETGSVERLRELVREGEALYMDKRFNEAALRLFEVAESPRFADFVDLPEFRGAEHMLAGALYKLGALQTAQRYLLRILSRGPGDVYFGPAFRRYTDVALDSGNIARALDALSAIDRGALSEDAANELRYLEGRVDFDAGRFDEAVAHFGEITKRSRFYANAQYLSGVVAAKRGQLGRAEELFCRIATTEDRDRFTFYVDERYFEVKDLAWLALGRVAHEGARPDDAFYYYFQVPADSDRVSEALFESAYAMYEGGDHETALDLLDQLEARFPESPFVDEARLLRGYVELAHCEFEEADDHFTEFSEQFTPVLEEIDRILASDARRERLYEQLLALEANREDHGVSGGAGDASDGQSAATASRDARAIILAMLKIEPSFYRLHADIRTLDAEAARAGRMGAELGAIAARIEGADRPRAAAAIDELYDEAREIGEDLERGRAVARSLEEQLDSMRRAGARRSEIEPLERDLERLEGRLRDVERNLTESMASAGAEVDEAVDGGSKEVGITALLARDRARARRLPARVATVRAKMINAANALAITALRKLRSRLASGLRRARIGRIDAVMGSKRRIEIQIESLAAGRFPPELTSPLEIQGLLRDDEEYWPYDGEYWADEQNASVEPEAALEEDE